jgi:hypothetical protein
MGDGKINDFDFYRARAILSKFHTEPRAGSGIE